MRPLRALGIYTAVVFIGGALLAPWIYWLVQSLPQAIPKLSQTSFQRFVGSTILGVAVAGFWPLFRALGATSLRDAGLTNPVEHWKRLMSGLLLGLISLAVIGALALAFGARRFEYNLTAVQAAGKLLNALLAAAVVAVLEETLFRGGVFGGLKRVFQWPFALLLSSMIYSLTHFLADANLQGEVTWASGLQLLPQMLGAHAGWVEAPPRFVNLTLVGVLLGLAYQRTGNLWFSIGLHAGWVFWLAIYRMFTERVPEASTWIWGSRKMIDGWMALPVLALTLVLFIRLPLARKTVRTHESWRKDAHKF